MRIRTALLFGLLVAIPFVAEKHAAPGSSIEERSTKVAAPAIAPPNPAATSDGSASTIAAVASAAAALFSALGAFLLLRVEGAKRRDAERPHIVLEGWKRDSRPLGRNVVDMVWFTRLRNAGKGPATHMAIFPNPQMDPDSLYIGGTIRPSLLAAGEPRDIDGRIDLHWFNVPNRDYASVNLEVLAWDTLGYRHQTIYKIFIHKNYAGTSSPDYVAPGVEISWRQTTVRSVRLLKFLTRLKVLKAKVKQWW